ncbi:MAG: LPS export ABC transporter periplasmic protein LptC [Desulfuromonadaceae bacterium]|nr:LPS export ABC transporter periplasmic protein LptC [Desulfuromonadaceae bacterium]
MYIRPLLALLVITAITAIAVVIFRNDPQGAVPVLPVKQQLPRNIDVSLKKARFSEIQDGLVSWELVAERADYDKSGETAYLADIRMVFQSSGVHGAITVTADNGEYSAAVKTVRLKGNIRIVTEDRAHFETDSIVYTGTSARFSTADPVFFSQDRLQLHAVGMDLGVENQRAHFHSAVEASIIRN